MAHVLSFANAQLAAKAITTAGGALDKAVVLPGASGSVMLCAPEGPAYGYVEGAVTDSTTDGTTVTPLTATYTAVTDEEIGDLTENSQTLANGNVVPGTVRLYVPGVVLGTPRTSTTWEYRDVRPDTRLPSYVATGVGQMCAPESRRLGTTVGLDSDRVIDGTINYATGVATIPAAQQKSLVAGDTFADYSYHASPTPPQAVPEVALLHRLIVQMVAGASVASVTVRLQETDTAGEGVIYSGTHAISPASPVVSIDLNRMVSFSQATGADRLKRFVVLAPDHATSEFSVKLHWERA